MRAKVIITRVILSAVAAGSITTGVAVPLAAAIAPSSGVVAVHVSPNVIVHDG